MTTMELVNPSTHEMMCKVCGHTRIAKLNKGGKYAASAWRCGNGCRQGDRELRGELSYLPVRMKRDVLALNRRLRDNADDHQAWLNLLGWEGSLEFVADFRGLLARLLERGSVTRAAIVEALGGEVSDQYSVVATLGAHGMATFSVKDDAGTVVKTFDSLMEALEHIDALSSRDREPLRPSQPEDAVSEPSGGAVVDLHRTLTHEMLFDIGRQFGTLR